ncbi:MAG: hypothetical protein Rpha_0587 [Candidatus Ruthia sp. Apha_13_S6]|nr:hypothetical protein [Candidatus Ruthia sp. Apha_13_S6]
MSKGCNKAHPFKAQKVCNFKIKFWNEVQASKSEIDILIQQKNNKNFTANCHKKVLYQSVFSGRLFDMII